jgi:hypothetical protein
LLSVEFNLIPNGSCVGSCRLVWITTYSFRGVALARRIEGEPSGASKVDEVLDGVVEGEVSHVFGVENLEGRGFTPVTI